MNKKKILDFLTMALLVIVCTVMVFALVARIRGEHHPKIFGYGFGVVMSGSMEPNLHEGSFIVIKEQDEYQVDDIITYNHKDGMSVTHRVKYIIDDEIIPKGDANEGIDDAITRDDIVGKVIFNCNSLYFFITVFLLACALIVFALIPTKEEEKQKKVEQKKPTKPIEPTKTTTNETNHVVNTKNVTDDEIPKEPVKNIEVKSINTSAHRITWPNLDEIRSLEEIRKSKETKPAPNEHITEKKPDVPAVKVADTPVVEPKNNVGAPKKPQSNMWRDSFKVSDEDKTN